MYLLDSSVPSSTSCFSHFHSPHTGNLFVPPSLTCRFHFLTSGKTVPHTSNFLFLVLIFTIYCLYFIRPICFPSPFDSYKKNKDKIFELKYKNVNLTVILLFLFSPFLLSFRIKKTPLLPTLFLSWKPCGSLWSEDVLLLLAMKPNLTDGNRCGR